jgi:intraflagellar transport protein 172
VAAEANDLRAAEALFLRAKRPEEALRVYKAARQWEEALRIAEDYLPTRVNEVHAELASNLSGGFKGNEMKRMERFS